VPLPFPSGLPKAAQTRFAKLGIHSRFDLVLHLPLRYEDETQLQSIAALAPGMSAQVEGEIVHSEVTYRPRRTLV
jgi:ATP-dependent DNA helicase RecG